MTQRHSFVDCLIFGQTGDMHEYSYNSDERRKWTVWLFRASVAISIALGLALAALEAAINQLDWIVVVVLQPPATMAVFRAVNNIFETWLWRTKWLRKFDLVTMPNLNGCWKGYVISSFDNELGQQLENPRKREVNVDIVQTWNQIRIAWSTDDSTSSSNVAAIVCLDNKKSELHYLYFNRTRTFAHKNMHAHSGATRLEIGESEMTGEYFTNRDPATKGDIHLKRVA